MSYGSHGSGAGDGGWGPQGGQYRGTSPNQDPDPWGRPPQKSGFNVLLVIILGGAGLILLCCGGLAGLGVYSFHLVADQVADDLRDNPVIVEHIGTIDEFEMDWGDSFSEDDNDVFVYRIRGPNGEGKVHVKSVSVDTDTEEVVWGYLEMSDGRRHDLLPEDGENLGEGPDYFESDW